MTTPFPPDSYPTSPPWAPPRPAPPAEPPFVPHGRLMVPYPELMADADRPKPPSWSPVAAFTLLFGPFGAISAARRAALARLGRNDRHPYWFTFGAALAVHLAAVALTGALLRD